MDEDVRKRFEHIESRIAKLEETRVESNPELPSKKISIKEFIMSKMPKDDVQKTLVIGYYLEKYEGITNFSSNDLKNAFMAAKEPVHNVNLTCIRNIKKGFMMESTEKKEKLKTWNLTNSGDRFVENNLPEASG